MGLHKISAGSGYTYLTRQTAANDVSARGRGGLEAYYSERGESPGVWLTTRGLGGMLENSFTVSEAQMIALFGEGRHPDAARIERDLIATGVRGKALVTATSLGRRFPQHDAGNAFHARTAGAYREHNRASDLPEGAPVPEVRRAEIRTRLAREMFTERHGRTPADARELSGFLARASRPAPIAVAGYDLTFSPVKSVSTFWALPSEGGVPKILLGAHEEAVRDTIGWLENHAAYTRQGAGGLRQVPVRGLIAAAFTHRDSRAGDPDLHTHVAVSNKVQTLAGEWLSLDGRALYKNKVAASEHYNTRLEALLVDRLGVRFADRPGPAGKRPVREIVGIDGPLTTRWSSRRTTIEARAAALAAAFQADHGRPPSPVEALALGQQATLETRAVKHGPRSEAEQRAVWRAEAVAVLGSKAALDTYVHAALHPQPLPASEPSVHSEPGLVAADVIGVLQGQRAVWQQNHVRAEAERAARTHRIPAVDVNAFVTEVVGHALSAELSVPLGGGSKTPTELLPAALRRADGTSVYEVAGSRRFTSATILAAEQTILKAAQRSDGSRVSEELLADRLLEVRARAVRLTSGQIRMVTELATSGRRVQLALAPAGTGKTTALRALAQAWTASGGTVIGLAPSAAAAAVLRAELGRNANACDTLAKLLHTINAQAEAGLGWVDRIDSGTLIVCDEAGMAGTLDLAQLTAFALKRGASVRLIGDDRQLAAVAAGGVLRDLADKDGAVTLTDVLRFQHRHTGTRNHAEAAASQALRAGDPAGIAHYTDHGRIHVGTPTTTLDQAYRAWAVDLASGLDAVMLAPTREQARGLNERARSDRLATQIGPVGTEVALGDATHASTGDMVVTRQNERRLAITDTDWVKNGDRWTVRAAHPDGGLTVTHRDTRRSVTLPAAYVAEHVQLGYATTVHSAQGMTADTAHTVATGQETRQLLYVTMTRGRYANHLYLASSPDGDPHQIIRPDSVRPPTAVELLTRVLANDEDNISATGEQRAVDDPAALLGAGVAEYNDAIAAAVEHMLGPDRYADIRAAAERHYPGLTDEPAWPVLRDRLARYALDGHQPEELLGQAIDHAPLAGARDIAAVLHTRLTPTPGPRADVAANTMPWLVSAPPQIAADPAWARYLHQQNQLLAQHAQALREQAASWTAETAPVWAQPFNGLAPRLVTDLAVWRAAHDVPTIDPQPAGRHDRSTLGAAVSAITAADEAIRSQLEQRAASVTDSSMTPTGRWQGLVTSHNPALVLEPDWPQLAKQLDHLARQGVDVPAALRDAQAVRPLPDEQPVAALTWRLHEHTPDNSRARTDVELARLPDRADGPFVTPETDITPGQRWADLAEHLHPGISQDRRWQALAKLMDEAQAAGWNVDAGLADVIGERPLGTGSPASELRLRLYDAVPALAPRSYTPPADHDEPAANHSPALSEPPEQHVSRAPSR